MQTRCASSLYVVGQGIAHHERVCGGHFELAASSEVGLPLWFGAAEVDGGDEADVGKRKARGLQLRLLHFALAVGEYAYLKPGLEGPGEGW